MECDEEENDVRDKAEWHKCHHANLSCTLTLSPLYFPTSLLLSLLPDLKTCRDGHQMGSMEANTHPPATSFPHLTATTISSHQLELLQRGLHLQSWGQTSLWYQKPSTGSREKSSLTSLRGVDLQQTNQVVDRTIVLLGLHLKWNRLQWCLSNGMELSDMSGFIGRISYRDYDTFVHTSQLGHFSRLACGQKRVIENHPSRGSLFWFAVGEKDFFFFGTI